MRKRMNEFCSELVPKFYRSVMDGSDLPDEVKPETLVTDVFDSVARQEFFDWVSTELSVECPHFSFSLTKTFEGRDQFFFFLFFFFFFFFFLILVAKICSSCSTRY